MRVLEFVKRSLLVGVVLGMSFQPLTARAGVEPSAVLSVQRTEETGANRPKDAFFVRVDGSTTTSNQSDPEWKYVPVRRISP